MAVKRKKIFVIFDEFKYTKKAILDSLQEEGFKHYYKMFDESDVVGHLTDYLMDSDEVWLFGEVDGLHETKLAKSLGCDLWRMG
jgi:hypothetical protein